MVCRVTNLPGHSNLLQTIPVHTAIRQCKTIGKTARIADRPYGKEVKMKKVNWWIVGIVAVLAVLFFFGGGMMWGNRSYGMMSGYGGHGMMGNWGNPAFGWFGMGLGMIFMWVIPIGIVALIVYGVIALVRQIGNSPQVAPQNSCANCGKGVQTDWQKCPYCGNALR